MPVKLRWEIAREFTSSCRATALKNAWPNKICNRFYSLVWYSFYSFIFDRMSKHAQYTVNDSVLMSVCSSFENEHFRMNQKGSLEVNGGEFIPKSNHSLTFNIWVRNNLDSGQSNKPFIWLVWRTRDSSAEQKMTHIRLLAIAQ